MLPVAVGECLGGCLNYVLQVIPYSVALACIFSSFVLKVPDEGNSFVSTLRHLSMP